MHSKEEPMSPTTVVLINLVADLAVVGLLALVTRIPYLADRSASSVQPVALSRAGEDLLAA
jgi:hypothetical protein